MIVNIYLLIYVRIIHFWDGILEESTEDNSMDNMAYLKNV